jgi:hypothetical protein
MRSQPSMQRAMIATPVNLIEKTGPVNLSRQPAEAV